LVHKKEDPLPLPDLTRHVEVLINGIARSLNVCFVVFYFASGAAAFCWHERWQESAQKPFLGARREESVRELRWALRTDASDGGREAESIRLAHL